MMRRRRMSGLKVIRWILLWILVGVKTRMVEAAEEEISARQEMVLRIETLLAFRLREESMARWKRRSACDRGWRAGEHWKKMKSKQPRKGPKDLQRK